MKFELTKIIMLALFASGCTTGKSKPESIGAELSQTPKINIKPLLGESGVDCGVFYSGDFFTNKQVKLFNRELDAAFACIKAANTKGVPFSVGHSFIGIPDASGGEIHIKTSDNRHVLLSYGEAGDSGYGVSVAVCKEIKLLKSGSFKSEECKEDAELFKSIIERPR